ncbi:hypothetical protein OEZ86_007525 [Tetradesmus obliquus]|nr:hypothetical protein OEZ86_007525 [Tetradesmus obliquus]
MSEATAVCRLGQQVLQQQHKDHPQFFKIGLPGIQGVEAVLHVLHDCYGYDYPGGLFLAAVDVMLEKATAVQPVQELLQAIAGGAAGKLKYWYSRAALHIAV